MVQRTTQKGRAGTSKVALPARRLVSFSRLNGFAAAEYIYIHLCNSTTKITTPARRQSKCDWRHSWPAN